MDFRKLETELNELIKVGEISKAIEQVENEIKQLPSTDFHKMIGRDLLHLSSKLNTFLNKFYINAKNNIEGNPNDFLNSIFKKPKDTGKTLEAISCELNGITINYDLWFITLMGFSSLCDNNEDILEWLGDYDYYSEEILIISGLEDIQKAYEDYMKNEKWELRDICDLCELLVILRLQELFLVTFNKESKSKNEPWTKIPVFINGHDVEIIYSTK